MDYPLILFAALVGFAIGSLIFWLLGNQKRIEEVSLQKVEKAKLEEQLANQKNQLQILDEAKETLSAQFQLTANKIFDEKSEKFKKQNKEGLENLLNPLKENLEKFDKQISDNREKDIKDRSELLHKILAIQKTGLQMSEDAADLVNAMKGESQVQGAWGEMILKKALEASGLVEGREYEVQYSGTSEEGKRLRPDVLLRLPGERTIILDSKVSLTAYERVVSADEEEERKTALKEHKNSVQNHIKQLSSKEYTKIKGIKTLDFVLMFIPIEAAFSAAVQKNSLLIEEALRSEERRVGKECRSRWSPYH